MSIKLKRSQFVLILVFVCCLSGCSKSPTPATPIVPPTTFLINSQTINSVVFNTTKTLYGINANPAIKISFSDKVERSSVSAAISYTNITSNAANVTYSVSYQNSDSAIVISPAATIGYLSQYAFSISTALKSVSGNFLNSGLTLSFYTSYDTTDKFPQLSDSALLDVIQKQTFKYFWDFGHPVCGMALERNTSGDVVTTGGSGFGIMAMIVAANRGFIKRTDAVTRLNTIVNFLSAKCTRWHGAFSHWNNGSTGATVPFGNNNGADIVETSYLMEGLLCARQYFNNTADVNETALRDSINAIWNKVEWSWFTQNGTQKSMYWQYNPTYTATSDIWSIPVTGWNEALITYVLAASSPTFPITKDVYDNGWAANGNIRNGNTYLGVVLPLGQASGGPLFFEQYSFLGINPNGLSDAYANYQTQTLAHTQINYNYCVLNPQQYYGYSSNCWGLTASDIASGYSASSPTNDLGYIAPTAAVSSLPYTPVQSMNAIRFFYYKLGDKLFGNYGFYDAFSLNNPWFATSTLAIDQGPQIGMIENYRTGLLWRLFMSCPEVKTGMKNLEFSGPGL